MIHLIENCCNASSPSLESAQPATRATSLAATDTARPLLIEAQPGAHCSIHPAGATSPADKIQADSDGKIRFFAPPRAWGSDLAIECGTGSSTQRISVNLNDTSTYKIDTDLLEQQTATSIRQPLTGDLQALPSAELLHRGYPPRPDQKLSPERYESWVKVVSEPRLVHNFKPVAMLGVRADEYIGSYNYYEDPENGKAPAWAGRAFNTLGWYLTSDPDFSLAPEIVSNWYLAYDTYMTVPTSTTCKPGGCQAFEWAGIGGMERLITGIDDSSLIQSGIYLGNAIDNNRSPTLFIDYAPESAYAIPDTAIELNAGDVIEAWAWLSSSTDCSDYDTAETGMVACFGFYNITRNEYMAQYGYYWWTPPYGTHFYGYTYESIVEKIANVSLTNYGSVQFNDLAYDVGLNPHDASTDPWVYLIGNSESRVPVSTPRSLDGEYPYTYEVDWNHYYDAEE